MNLTFFMENSDSDNSAQLLIAKWSDRFFAWLIDFILISIILGTIISVSFGMQEFEMHDDWIYAESYNYFPTSIVFFIYWIILETKNGQSIGKMALKIKTVTLDGKTPDIKNNLINSFGKSFLLPIDLIFGLIFTNEKRQRIFSKFGKTIVIKIKKDDSQPKDVTYKLD